MLFQKRQAAGIFCFSGIVICQRYSQIDTQLVKGTQVVAAELGTVKDPPPIQGKGFRESEKAFYLLDGDVTEAVFDKLVYRGCCRFAPR
jgi:hypothetical protein